MHWLFLSMKEFIIKACLWGMTHRKHNNCVRYLQTHVCISRVTYRISLTLNNLEVDFFQLNHHKIWWNWGLARVWAWIFIRVARKIQLKLDNLLHRMVIVFWTFGKTKSESSECPPSLPSEAFSELQVKIQAAEFCNTTDNKHCTGLRVGGREGGDFGGRWRECKGESGRL